MINLRNEKYKHSIEENITKLIDNSVAPNFKYNGKGILAYKNELIAFHNAFPKSTTQTKSFNLDGGEVKIFTLTKGKMMNDFHKKKATFKTEYIGCICNLQFDLKNKVVKNIKTTFEFLDKNDIQCLKNENIFQNKIKKKSSDDNKLNKLKIKTTILNIKKVKDVKKAKDVKKGKKSTKTVIKKGGYVLPNKSVNKSDNKSVNKLSIGNKKQSPWKCTMYSNV
jgi:hypothetical protein